MATTMTLAQLRTAAQQRADMVGGSFVSDAEWTSYINQSAFELYDLLVEAYGNDYYVATPATISTDGTNELFALNAAFYKLLGVELQLSGAAGAANGVYVTLKPFDFAERNDYPLANAAPVARSNMRYRLNGSNMWIKPLPASGQTIRYWYVPRMTQLSGESDTIDGISGWTEYVIVDAAIKASQKEESDVSALMAQKQALLRRIEAAANNRDAGNPATVADTSGSNFYGGAFGNGWDF